MRAITLRPPARDLSPLHREFDSLLGRFFGNDNEWLPGVSTGRWVPPLESFLREGELVVRLDVPGIAREALDISVEGDRLTVRGERRDSSENAENGRTYREVVYGAFERSISLPWDVDPSTVKAQCKDGVLEITMKAPEKMGAKKIEIQH
ncbi:MAG TPA: Hsp20/alpha crystallin family protein [Candidatus Limnocylindrales bacterium]|nr:Hsp20/alpha crystallin family protein [Candidatus Limnocylindrales bacterium]